MQSTNYHMHNDFRQPSEVIQKHIVSQKVSWLEFNGAFNTTPVTIFICR